MAEKKRKGIYERFIKRPLDIAISAVSIVCMSPCYLVVAILVKKKLGSPVIFKQERPGKNEKIFTMYKFRTMNDARDITGELLPDSARLTDFGRMLRSTSLDELPELFNILKGDMSLVGPRPLLVSYLDRYSEFQRHRHDVRPGLTGYSQVNGRNAVSWEEKFEMDVWYVDHVSFMTDLRIAIKTFTTVMKRDGISSGTSETMEEFMGTEEKRETSEEGK